MPKIKLTLMNGQIVKQRPLSCPAQYGMCAQQHGGVGQQGHVPRQSQAIQKGCLQSQLVFLISLRRFDPWTDLLEQPLDWQTGQWQQAEEGFMLTGPKGELTWQAEASQH